MVKIDHAMSKIEGQSFVLGRQMMIARYKDDHDKLVMS